MGHRKHLCARTKLEAGMKDSQDGAGPDTIRLARDLLLLAGFCGFLFFFGLSYFGLMGADEPRYAQVAREMLFRHDWVTPTLFNHPWLEKPPLYYWQAAFAYRLFGVSDWAARLPSAVDAAFMVAGIYFFLRRFRPGIQLDGALIAASCAGIVGFGRAASTDMPLAAMFTMAMLAWYGWCESRNRRHLALAYLFLALATLAKGPIAVLLAGLIILVFALMKRDSAILRETLWTPGMALFCVIALPWYIAVQICNPQFFKTFIFQHNLERFGTNLYHHPEPFWFFLPVLLIALLPWTVLLVTRLPENFRCFRRGEKQNTFAVFLAIWLIVPIIFFSFSYSKLPGYILPALPAASLLVAVFIGNHTANTKLPFWHIASHSVVATTPVFLALMIPYIMLQHRIPWGRATEFSLAVAGGVGVVVASALKVFGLRVLRSATLVAVVLTVAIVLRIGAPAIDAALSSRPLARAIGPFAGELHGAAGPPQIAVFEVPRETEYGLGFYLNRPVSRYENQEIPSGEHIVVAPAGSQEVVAKAVSGREVSYLGTFAPQRLDYFLVSR